MIQSVAKRELAQTIRFHGGTKSSAAGLVSKELVLFCILVWLIRGLIRLMWIVYALAAAIIWGISYAASGRVIERGMTPLVFFFLYTFFGAAAAAAALVVSGKAGALVSEFRSLEHDWVWLLVAIISSVAGGLLIYIAIGEKNATLASLIEISYPFFVAIFAWLFFRDIQFTWQTLVGGALILGGVAVVFLSERH